MKIILQKPLIFSVKYDIIIIIAIIMQIHNAFSGVQSRCAITQGSPPVISANPKRAQRGAMQIRNVSGASQV